MSFAKSVLVAGSLILLTSGVLVGDSRKTTNWKVETTFELCDPTLRDSTIESHESSIGKSREKVEKLVAQLREQLAKRIPSVFYDNPPWAGTIKVTAVLRPSVSLRSSSVDESSRATKVSDTLHAKGRLPGTEGDLAKQKRVDELKFKTTDPELMGLRIQVFDMTNTELQNTWYQASASGKMDIKRCASEIASVMSLVASRSETPVFEGTK